ncbi:trafficking protein particle complex subunit 12 [Agrilus planipennis]|uniref:Trafficking protein particle complex subunit 12 n=1 Tax=Agrilus planipennis TaxID=224129 RepID=A0A1W4XHY4_AGRPL|nr:trafficking protein particle complex subunit 12 [Agrilus planipennis]
MSQQSVPSLSKYFGTPETTNKTGNQDFSNVEETTEKLNSFHIKDNSKIEPVVCRIFSETSNEPKDPTAAFFDLIGNGSSTDSGISSNLGISSEDGFTPRISVDSEADRRRDAWIPSERTRQCLITCATSPLGTYFPDRELLTMPGVLVEEEFTDNIEEAVTVCLGEAEACQRKALTAADVTQDERGLRELVQAGAYRAALNLTARLLTIYGQGRGRTGHPTKHSPHSLQLWFTRISLLVKTKSTTLAQAEAEPFDQLDKPDLFYEFYPEMYKGRRGSIASFSFRLLLAELPMHCGKPKESLTKLFNILSTVRKMLLNLKNGLCEDGSPTEIKSSDRNDSIRLWTGRETRILHSIVNCSLLLKDYILAMDILGQLAQREGAPRSALLSALGRLHLQVGDINGAEACFNEARELKGGEETIRDLVDRGLVAVAQNSFNEAYTFFQKASLLEPNNVMILNNMAVCLLYGGHLKEAIGVLEAAIAQSPVQALQESLLLNLCTLYDMESSKGRLKKFALLRQISKYQADAPTQILEKLYG